MLDTPKNSVYFYIMTTAHLTDCCFGYVFLLELAKHLVAIFGCKFNMPEVYADFVAVLV